MRKLIQSTIVTAVLLSAVPAFAGDDHDMSDVDKNKDNMISKQEFLDHKEQYFTKFDKNSDGKLDQQEKSQMKEKMHDKRGQMGKHDDAKSSAHSAPAGSGQGAGGQSGATHSVETGAGH